MNTRPPLVPNQMRYQAALRSGRARLTRAADWVQAFRGRSPKLGRWPSFFLASRGEPRKSWPWPSEARRGGPCPSLRLRRSSLLAVPLDLLARFAGNSSPSTGPICPGSAGRASLFDKSPGKQIAPIFSGDGEKPGRRVIGDTVEDEIELGRDPGLFLHRHPGPQPRQIGRGQDAAGLGEIFSTRQLSKTFA